MGDDITLGSGTLHLINSDGAKIEFNTNDIKDLNVENAVTFNAPPDMFPISLNRPKSFTITISYDMDRLISVLMGYHNRRVLHLALHGKTQRVKKKNRKRIIRELKLDYRSFIKSKVITEEVSENG